MKKTLIALLTITLNLIVAVPCFSQFQEKGLICGNVLDSKTNDLPRGTTFFIAHKLNEEGQFERVWGVSENEGGNYFCLLLPFGNFIIEAWGENYEHLSFKSFWGRNGKVTHWSNPELDVITLSSDSPDFSSLVVDLKPLPFYVYHIEVTPERIPSQGGMVTVSLMVYSELSGSVLLWPTAGKFWKPMTSAKKASDGAKLNFSFDIPRGAGEGEIEIGIGAGRQPNPQLNFVFQRKIGKIQKGELPPPSPQ